ncbi:hypothetical protein EYD10_06148 [Varanus komodoensis]|nr:hypothetical protein EYD10_06148 [Varanus komodoensis]
MTCPSWVALHGIAHSFIELHKPLHHDKAVIHEGGTLTMELLCYANLEVWLRANYLIDFKHHFMCHFPYSFQEMNKHRKKDSLKSNKYCMTSSNNVDHLLLNLTLCEIMVSLASVSTLQMDYQWLDMIRKFVIETLQDGSKLNSKQLTKLLRVAWRLLQIQINKVATETLMKAVYTLYQQKGLPFPVRTLLLKFFSNIYQKEELNPHTNRSKSKVLSRWLAGLPQQLVLLGLKNPELSDHLIDIIYSAASRANKGILQSLQAAAPRIYGNFFAEFLERQLLQQKQWYLVTLKTNQVTTVLISVVYIKNPLDGIVTLLPTELQQRLVQLVYFLPHLPSNLLSFLSHCCIMGKLSVKLSTTLIGILHMRSSFVGWKYPVQDSSVTDVDYFSFLFSTLTGFSKEELNNLQNIRGRPHISQTQLSPFHLYLTDLDQFLYHWALTEVVSRCLSTVPSRSQCIDIIQSGICKYLAEETHQPCPNPPDSTLVYPKTPQFLHQDIMGHFVKGLAEIQVGLTVIPDSTAGSVLCAISKLLDQACLLNENLCKFLASLCYSLLYLLLTIEREDAEHLQKSSVLINLFFALEVDFSQKQGRTVGLLYFIVNNSASYTEADAAESSSDQSLSGRIACSCTAPPVANATWTAAKSYGDQRASGETDCQRDHGKRKFCHWLLELNTLKSGEAQEQWLTDLHYYFNIYLATHPSGSGTANTLY